MTALRKYDRLESPGLWREHPQAKRREVIVGLREATIILSDPKNEMALAQWSLPALERLNPGESPALYGPGADAPETLEVEDTDMIAALETVRTVLERRRPHPGRLRGVVLGTAALLVVGVVVFWLPGKLVQQTAAVLPAPTRDELGEFALADLGRLTGSACKSVSGRHAAAELATRLFPKAPPRIEVVRNALTAPLLLPGNLIVLPAALVEGSDGPDTLAGYLLATELAAKGTDPVTALLDHMGLAATLRLLTSGATSSTAITGYGEILLALPPPSAPDTDALLAAFRSANVSATPYALRQDHGAAISLALVQGDPFPDGSGKTVLTDESWIQLQAICSK